MVTFSLDSAEAGQGTPRSRPPLPFAKRTFAATPYAKRVGTPQASSSRKQLTTRDPVPSSSLNQNSIASARNIFGASTITNSPPVSAFSPSLPQSTMKKVFAPGVTPEPSRVLRESTARPTPRGMAAHSTDKDLFHMRIASPPPELTGEVLANKVPKDWNSKGSIYADQFLAHLCPPDFDEEQRRQFFCILDLRRLKYAANEIFAKKSWKLNIINFAKEFDKSRSIILLRYGLYEFQNVKPSKEVLRRWRREHGLPDPEDEETEVADSTPSKPAASKKRKADDNLSKDSVATPGKRRATVRDEEDEPTAATPALNKNKRKTFVNDEQPTKIHKAAPSSAKSLFERIANKPAPAPSAAPVKRSDGPPAAKPAAFGTAKNTKGGLVRSVFTNLKPPSNDSIFSYPSDASSAKNSGVEADAESETESDREESQGAGQSDEPSSAASGPGTQAASNLFGIKTGSGTASSSGAETRESTPGRSLFQRITKNQDGQPLRADEHTEPAATQKPTSLNQTWNPSSTPIKFAPSASASQTGSLFAKPTSTPASSIFAPKSTAPSNIFGAPKQASQPESKAEETDKSGEESDKENDSKPSKKVSFAPREPAAQSSIGSSLFGLKPAATETPKESEPAKPATNLFGLKPAAAETSKGNESAKPASNLFGIQKPEATSNLFGTMNKSTPVMQSSTLFGTKPAEPEKKSESEASKATPVFGAPSTSASTGGTNASTSLFGIKPAATSGGLFGGASSAPSQTLFGTASSTNASAPVKTDPTPASAAPSLFSFGSTSNAAEKPTATSQAAAKALFGAPKSPPTSTTNSLFAGSPMKQDEASPAKKPFAGGSNDVKPQAPLFSFSASTTTTPSSSFGGSLTATANTEGNSTPAFGAAPSSNAGSGGFNFAFGSGGPSGSTFNNPFAGGNPAGNSAQAPAPGSGGMFSFGASSTPAGGSGSFQFGASGTQAGQSSAPVFGASSSSGSAPAFTVTAPSSQPSQNMFSFGASQPSSGFNLQPPAGGSSTTGTNSPFNLGGGSSLATTPAGGTPEPSSQAATSSGADKDNEDGEKHEQISLTEGAEKDEEILHEVRAKVLKFVPASEASDSEEKKAKSKSPWATQGVGRLRLLKHKETSTVRLLLRAEPRGNVAMNRSVLPDLSYEANEKYVKVATSNDEGNGLETWMLQVKTKDFAKALAEALEKHKGSNKK